MKLEAESVARCVEILRNAGSPLEWEAGLPAKVAAEIEAVRQHVGRSIWAINEHADEAARHIETALQVQRLGFPTLEDSACWTAALRTVRTNLRIIHQANARVLEMWDKLALEVLDRVETLWAEARQAADQGAQCSWSAEFRRPQPWVGILPE